MSRHLLVWVSLSLVALSATAEPENDGDSQADIRSLERQAEAVRSGVLDLEAELSALEEDIRYPAATRWSVYVTAEPIPDFELDMVELQVDGVIVATHRYDAQERTALEQGGAHRLHVDNLAPGTHLVSTQLSGDYQGERYTRNNLIKIEKTEGPRLLELRLQPAVPTSGDNRRSSQAAPGFAQQSYPDLP